MIIIIKKRDKSDASVDSEARKFTIPCSSPPTHIKNKQFGSCIIWYMPIDWMTFAICWKHF